MSDLSEYNVSVIGPRRADEILAPVCDMLEQLGVRVARHLTLEAFLARDSDLPQVDVLVANPGLPIDEAVLGRMPRLRALFSPVTGTDGFDEAAATRLSVAVGNAHTPENYECMADGALLLMLAALYDLPGAMARMAPGVPRGPVRGRMLRGRTVGLIGYGKIAQALAARLTSWPVQILVSAPRLHARLPAGGRQVDLPTLMATSDVVCVLCNLNDETRGMLTGELLGRLKTDAVLVNVARGEIIDDAALAQVCAARPDIRVALDAFTIEPLPVDSPLRSLSNAILTPHNIGHSAETFEAVREATVENVRCVLEGRLPPYLRNPAISAAWRARWAGGEA